MQLFTVTIGPRQAPRLQLEVMAPDSATAAAQHMDLAEGERLEVTPAQRMRAELQQLADEIKARAQATQQLRRRAMAIEPVTLPARVEQPHTPYISTAYRSCCLCGEPCETFTCNRCARRSRSL